MRRKVKLLGKLGELFGEEHYIHSVYLSDIFKCIAVNNPKFKEFVISNRDSIVIETQSPIDDIGLPLHEADDVVISLAIEGSKGGTGKLLAAAAIVGLVMFNPAFFAVGGKMMGTFAWGINTAGQVALAVAANLALTGVQQLMAPDPATDSDEPESYLFNGSQQNVVEGDPVPVLYGELMVPGTPISFELVNRGYYKNNTFSDYNGNILI